MKSFMVVVSRLHAFLMGYFILKCFTVKTKQIFAFFFS